MLGRFLALASVLLLAISPLAAQEARGSIGGRIMDTSNAVIPNAKVTISNTLTNESRRVTSNQTGYYEVNFLEPIDVRGCGRGRRIQEGAPQRPRIERRLETRYFHHTGSRRTRRNGRGYRGSPSARDNIGERRTRPRQPATCQPAILGSEPVRSVGTRAGMQWTGQPEYRRPFDNGGTSRSTLPAASGKTNIRWMASPSPAQDVASDSRHRPIPFRNSNSRRRTSMPARDSPRARPSTSSAAREQINSTVRYSISTGSSAGMPRPTLLVCFGRIRSRPAKSARTSRSRHRGARTITVSGVRPGRIPKIFNGRDKLFWTFT